MLNLAMERHPESSSEVSLVFFHDHVHLLLLCRGGSRGHSLSFPFRMDHEEDKFLNLGDYLYALFRGDDKTYAAQSRYVLIPNDSIINIKMKITPREPVMRIKVYIWWSDKL